MTGTAEALAERALEFAVDTALTLSRFQADIMAALVLRGAMTEADAREVMMRAAGVIRYAQPDAASRVIYQKTDERLRERLGWSPGAPALPVDPLPPDEQS